MIKGMCNMSAVIIFIYFKFGLHVSLKRLWLPNYYSVLPRNFVFMRSDFIFLSVCDIFCQSHSL
jgi:hypothetical protein